MGALAKLLGTESPTPAQFGRDYIHHEHVLVNFVVTDIGDRSIARCKQCPARWTLTAADRGNVSLVLEILHHGYEHAMRPLKGNTP